MKAFVLFCILMLPAASYAQPVDFEIQEVQLFFGDITDLDCCLLLPEKAKAPFRGFLLSPYQLVFLKDTIDSWSQELQLQLQHVNDICDQKLRICQDTRAQLLDELKDELTVCTTMSEKLIIQNEDLLSDKTFLKSSLYITVPLSIALGIYVGSLL